MNDLGQLFDAFYSHFILRDFFGKIAPGTIFLSALALWFKSPTDLLEISKGIPLVLWLLFLAIAWLAGFAVQSFGEYEFRALGPLILYDPRFPEKADYGADFHVDYRDLLRTGEYPQDDRQIERFVVIKEACGNGYVAILLSIGVLALKVGHNIALNFGVGLLDHELVATAQVIVFLLPIMVLLRRMHYEHVWRQYEYSQKFLVKYSEEARRKSWPEEKPVYPHWGKFLIYVVVGIIMMFTAGVVLGLLDRLALGVIALPLGILGVLVFEVIKYLKSRKKKQESNIKS